MREKSSDLQFRLRLQISDLQAAPIADHQSRVVEVHFEAHLLSLGPVDQELFSNWKMEDLNCVRDLGRQDMVSFELAACK